MCYNKYRFKADINCRKFDIQGLPAYLWWDGTSLLKYLDFEVIVS